MKKIPTILLEPVFELGQVVYCRTDREQRPMIVSGYIFEGSEDILYRAADLEGDFIGRYYHFSEEPDQSLKLNL